MSTWRMVRGQLSGRGMLAASLPQQLVAYFLLMPRLSLSTPSVAGAAGLHPAATLFSCLLTSRGDCHSKKPIHIPEWEQPRRRSRPGDEGKPSGFSLISV